MFGRLEDLNIGDGESVVRVETVSLLRQCQGLIDLALAIEISGLFELLVGEEDVATGLHIAAGVRVVRVQLERFFRKGERFGYLILLEQDARLLDLGGRFTCLRWSGLLILFLWIQLLGFCRFELLEIARYRPAGWVQRRGLLRDGNGLIQLPISGQSARFLELGQGFRRLCGRYGWLGFFRLGRRSDDADRAHAGSQRHALIIADRYREAECPGLAGVASRFLAAGTGDRAAFGLGFPFITEGRIGRRGRNAGIHEKVLECGNGARHLDETLGFIAPDTRRRSCQAWFADFDFVGLRRDGDALLPQVVAAVLSLAVDRHGHRRRVFGLIGVGAGVSVPHDHRSRVYRVALDLPPECDVLVRDSRTHGDVDSDILTRIGRGGVGGK